jgi:hypothetical protein
MNYNDYREERKEGAKWLWWLIGVVILLIVAGGIVGFAMNWLSLPGKILDPNAALVRWQWFYDTKTGLDGLSGNIKQAEASITDYEKFNGDPSTWGWSQQQEHSRLTQVKSGYINRYNSLAQEYNAKMDDITRNWSAPPDLPKHIQNWND